ncbi:MAG: VCBS repeat-containing protein, partial [Myxococcota bacterium]|nr:VCBS repeat-containing protein [Myxococcota bacterium]
SSLPLEAAPPEAERAALAAGGRTLMRVALSVERGLFSARGDLFRVRPNFWSGVSGTRSGPGAALASSTEVDAHALALAAPLLDSPSGTLPPLRLLPSALVLLPTPTAALAAADLDADGRDEVVVLTDRELQIFSPTGTLLARRSLRELPATTTPCREPYGVLAVAGAKVAYFSGRQGRGEWVELQGRQLHPVGPLAQPVVAVGISRLEGTWTPGQNTFRVPPLPAPVVHAATFLGASGSQLLAVMPDGTGSWLWLDSSRAPVPLASLGAASTLVDLDGDGHPELATTSADFLPRPDAIRVTDAGQTVLWEVPLERGRILQLIPADLDGDGQPELVAGVWLPDGTAELRVLRRAGP